MSNMSHYTRKVQYSNTNQYSRYLNITQFKKILDPFWYNEFIEKIKILEELKFKLSITELNIYMLQRYLYENNKSKTFDDTKYDLENYYVNGYEPDVKLKPVDIAFDRTMDMLAEKLKNTRFYLD